MASGPQKMHGKAIYIASKTAIDVGVGLLGAITVVMVVPTQSLRVSDSKVAALVPVLLIGLLLLRLGLSRFARQKVSPASDVSFVDLPSDEFLMLAEDTFLQRHSLLMIRQLVGTMLDPAGYFDRVKEGVEIKSSRYEKTTNLVFRRSVDGPSLVPLLSQRKQRLIDDLDIHVDGGPGSTLSYIENQGALLLLLETLYMELAQATSNSGGNAFTDELLKELKRMAAAPYPVDHRGAQGRLVKAAADAGLRDRRTFLALDLLLAFAATNYFILGVVDKSDVTTAKVTIKSSFDRRASEFTFLSIVRIAVGLRRRDHLFTLERAFESVSYHFSLRTPRGMYVHENILDFISVGKEPREDDPTPLPQHRGTTTLAEVRRGRSTKFIHVYLRDHAAGELQASVPALRLNLRERPPALLEVCMLVSLGLSLLVWVAGANYNDIFQVTGTRVGSWPTVLFGIPTLLASWLVSRIDSDAMARMSLSSLFSFAWLSCNSVAAVTIAAFQSGGLVREDDPWSLVGLDLVHPLWSILMLSCITHSIATSFLASSRSVRYALVSLGLTDITVPEHNERRKESV